MLEMGNNVLKHLKTILIHKYWVGKYCFKAGLYWRGITHDLSKFSPTEFRESVVFYTGDASPIDTAKKKQGYSLAWFHHRGRNDHHHIYWVDNIDEGGIAIKMPFDCAIEMICDYLGAARAYLGDSFSYKKEWDWWNSKSGTMKMNMWTKELVEVALMAMAVSGNEKFLEKIADDAELRKVYENGDSFALFRYELVRRKINFEWRR